MPPSKISLLAVCMAAALATGCASTAKKPVAVTEPAATATQPADNQPKPATEGAQTGALNNGGGLNSQGMAGDNTASGGSASTSGSGPAGGSTGSATAGSGDTTGSGADNGNTAAASLSDRLVNFDFDSSDIRQEDYPTLLAHARYLQQNPQAKVTLEGHADERGTREYNMALGERRAKAVEAFLGVNGARSNQLDSVSFGKEKPLNDGHDEAAWAENRRVELNYEAGAPKP
ncbi:peptidoglycan-associated lipoprotein Pal [Fluviicoccus keumensis]|uniref:peptidoglycan-associated lipoprotein Pal n=1 Tax=Fluviicoccus keumensis TaxID=1435465 RepID=UPI003BF89524